MSEDQVDRQNPDDEPPGREAKWTLDRLESCIGALRMAKALHDHAEEGTRAIEAVLDKQESRRDALRQRVEGAWVEPRRRAKLEPEIESRPRATVFMDECGGHGRPASYDLPVFCLCCLIVDDTTYEELLIPRWEGIKARFLQATTAKGVMGRSRTTHEPSLRSGSKRLFHRLKDVPGGPEQLETELRSLIVEVPFTLIAAVVNTAQFYDRYGDAKVDTFLPASIYDLCLDFAVERVVHFLSPEGYQGHVIAEGRGRRDDAVLQYEFVRLQLEGTQYVSDSWIRQQLSPTIEFRTKEDNCPGLQLVDLFARPIADKVAYPDRPNPRWDALKNKLYDGGKGRVESYGLKCFPNPIDPGILS